MITDLWIENFKGIGKRQHIPLRPITLLFEANNSGKTTVSLGGFDQLIAIGRVQRAI